MIMSLDSEVSRWNEMHQCRLRCGQKNGVLTSPGNPCVTAAKAVLWVCLTQIIASVNTEHAHDVIHSLNCVRAASP